MNHQKISKKGWGDTFWLVHDTLSSNGVPRNHPFLLETVLRFHVDALTHVNVKQPRIGEKGGQNSGPKNQWFLVVEGVSLQACLSMQPCANNRTGAFGTLTLQIMDCYVSPPSDLLHRQTYTSQRENLTAKAVLETAFFNGWHKYEMVPGDSGFLWGRRHHMMAMLYDLQDTGWIGRRTLQDLQIQDYLEREYMSRQWAADNHTHPTSRAFAIRPGKFRPDLGTQLVSPRSVSWQS